VSPVSEPSKASSKAYKAAELAPMPLGALGICRWCKPLYSRLVWRSEME
jgi:hypothetical protein